MAIDESRFDDVTARLIRIEEQHKNIMAMLANHTAHEEHWQEQISEALNGNGKPGIKTRLDRIESAYNGITKNFWLVWSAIVAAAGTVLVDVVKSHIH